MPVAPSLKGLFHLAEQVAVGTPVSVFTDADILWANAAVPALAQDVVRSEIMRPGFGAPPITAGNKEGDVAVEMPVHGWSAITPATDPTIVTDILLAKHGFGAIDATLYQATLAGGTDTGPLGVTLEPGAPKLFELVTAGNHGAGWAFDASTLSTALPEDPAAGPTAIAYGAMVAVIAEPGETPLLPLTLQWLGADDATAVRYSDMAVSTLTYAFDSRMQPRVSATLRHLSWIRDATGGAPPVPPASAVLPEMPIAVGENGARLMIDGVMHCVGPFSLTITNALAVRECHGQSQLLITNRVVTVEFTGSRDALGDSWDIGKVLTNLQLDLNTTPGRSLTLHIPELVVTGPESPADRNGLLNTLVQAEAVDVEGFPLASLAWS